MRALGQHPIPPFLATGEVASFTRHDGAGVDDIERNQSDEHRKGVKQVLVDFVGDRGALCPFGIFTKAEDDANLNKSLVRGKERLTKKNKKFRHTVMHNKARYTVYSSANAILGLSPSRFMVLWKESANMKNIMMNNC